MFGENAVDRAGHSSRHILALLRAHVAAPPLNAPDENDDGATIRESVLSRISTRVVVFSSASAEEFKAGH